MNERTTEFERFWTTFPRRVGKLAAQRAYQRARTAATAEEILDGIARYVRYKPAYADFCHPATWLNQGRWMDDYSAPAPVKANYPECPHEPRCHSKVWCAARQQKEAQAS